MGTGAGGNFGNTYGHDKVHGYTKKLNEEKQGKHTQNHNNYQKGKSIFYGSANTAQDLINKHGGTGQWIGNNKERVDFGKTIGAYIYPKTGKSYKTTVGIIHYSSTGAHIVPAQPKNWRK